VPLQRIIKLDADFPVTDLNASYKQALSFGIKDQTRFYRTKHVRAWAI